VATSMDSQPRIGLAKANVPVRAAVTQEELTQQRLNRRNAQAALRTGTVTAGSVILEEPWSSSRTYRGPPPKKPRKEEMSWTNYSEGGSSGSNQQNPPVVMPKQRPPAQSSSSQLLSAGFSSRPDPTEREVHNQASWPGWRGQGGWIDHAADTRSEPAGSTWPEWNSSAREDPWQSAFDSAFESRYSYFPPVPKPSPPTWIYPSQNQSTWQQQGSGGVVWDPGTWSWVWRPYQSQYNRW
jgi:hypothetical protein